MSRGVAAAATALVLGLFASGAGGSGPSPITIGVLSDCLGPFAPNYPATLAGAELPLLERGAKLAGADPAGGVAGASMSGHPVRVVFGCGDTHTVRALAEARRLVEALGADVLIGPDHSDEETALPEYARRRLGITFVNGAGGAFLRDPPPNFFSFHADGRQWSAGLGSYAFHRLGWHTAVVLANPDAFNWLQVAGFEAEFCSLGGRIAKRIWFPVSTTDYAAVLGRIPRGGVDGFFVQGFSGVEKSLVQNYPGLRASSARRVLGGVWSEPGSAFWLNVRGQVFADPNGTPRAAQMFMKRLYRLFPSLDRSRTEDFIFAVDYYGAMTATLRALQAVGGDLSEREQRFQAALARVELDLPIGHVRLAADHQAVVPNYLWRVNKPNGSDRTLLRIIRAVDRTFGGYFSRRDPPPNETTPACRKGHVPPWARSG